MLIDTFKNKILHWRYKVVILKCDKCIQFLVGFPIKRPCQSVDNQGFPVEKIYMDHNISLDGYNPANEFPVFRKMCHHSFCLLRVLKNHDDSPQSKSWSYCQDKDIIEILTYKGHLCEVKKSCLILKILDSALGQETALAFLPQFLTISPMCRIWCLEPGKLSFAK